MNTLRNKVIFENNLDHLFIYSFMRKNILCVVNTRIF